MSDDAMLENMGWKSLDAVVDEIGIDDDDKEALKEAVHRLGSAGIMFYPFGNRTDGEDSAYFAAYVVLDRSIGARCRPFFHRDEINDKTVRWVDVDALKEIRADKTLSESEQMKLDIALSFLGVDGAVVNIENIIAKFDVENYGHLVMAMAVRRKGLKGSTL